MHRHNIHIIYLLTAIFHFAFGLLAYVTSTFLAETTRSDTAVSMIYTVGSLLAIVGLIWMPPILRTFGNIKTTIIITVLTALTLVVVSTTDISPVIVLLFLFYLIFIRLLVYNIDLLLEHFSRDSDTGGIRGAYLSISHLTLAAGPLVAGLLLDENNYNRLFILAAVLFLLLIPVLLYNFKRYRDPKYHEMPFLQTIKNVYKNNDLRDVFIANLLLRFFYVWMVVYTPIYLHEHIGIAWEQIGFIFTIMLLPFVFLEYPLGKIADSKLGEKEIMIAGFVVLAVATGSLSFITTSLWWLWALALFATRIGASMVESMAETYFFKKIDSEDSELLSTFKITSPLAYVVAPLTASATLAVVGFKFLFLVLAVIVLFGIPYTLKLHDTR